MAAVAEPNAAHLRSFWDYREYFKARLRRSLEPASGESSADYARGEYLTPFNERLIQAIWANQFLQTEGLKLADGRPVRVIDPGRWNGAAGPDFQAARLMIGTETIAGDVEIHLQAGQWRAHRHEADLDYNGVVLHVVYRIDDGRQTDDLHNGESIPRLEIEPYLFPDIETIRRSMSPDDFPYDRPAAFGRCHEMMTTLDSAMIADFLDRAGDERLTAKIRRLEDQLRNADPEQVFYQASMMALGTGPSKTLYYLLAKRAPAAELRDYAGELEPALRRRAMEAILLHVAGLMPREEDLAEAPEESRRYAAELSELWRRFEPCWTDRLMAPTRRWLRGIRPVNFPYRRLAAVSRLLVRAMENGTTPLEDLAHRVRAAAPSLENARRTRRVHPTLRDLFAWFESDDPGSFWAGHYSFAARPSARRMTLIGDATARSLVFNAALPALGLLARRDGDATLDRAVRRLYAIFPPLQDNHITQFMSRRLFGETGQDRELLTTERRRQGLFQIFYACCNSEERHCDSCYFFRAK